jgi:hypothetical protein
MNNNNIPKSYWRLEKVYFTAKPVDDFKAKYLEWLEDYDGSDNLHCEKLHEFLDYISKNDLVQLYESPPYKSSSEELDYFEILDDNHVIPRHLFEVVEF